MSQVNFYPKNIDKKVKNCYFLIGVVRFHQQLSRGTKEAMSDDKPASHGADARGDTFASSSLILYILLGRLGSTVAKNYRR
jgi:hypothetical protein